MVEIVNLLQTCPRCGKILVDLTDEGITVRNCNHFVWISDLGSITNDEIHLRQGVKLRLLKR